MTVYENEAGLRDFLVTMWTEGEATAEEVVQEDGSLVGVAVDGTWKKVDTYHVSPDFTAFNGREVVFKDGAAIWATNYHTVIPDMELRDSVLSFFLGPVAVNRDPNFPLTGVNGLENDTFKLTYEPLLDGPLTLARFAVRDTITHKPSDRVAFLSHLIGGWIN